MSDENIYYCVGCGTEHSKQAFYKSFSSNHANGRLFFCKDFMREKCYDKHGNIVKEDFRRLMRQLNLAYIPSLIDEAIEKNRDPMGAYFSTYNGLSQYRGMTWEDGEEINNAAYEYDGEVQNTPEMDSFVLTANMIRRWGQAYEKHEVMKLEHLYNEIAETHDIKTPQHRTALVMICKLQLKMDTFLDNGDIDQYSKHHKEYQTLMKTSGLRPVDRAGTDEETGMRSFSQIFEEVERDGFIKPDKTRESQDIVDKTIQYMGNYTRKLLNKNVMTEPPTDTPKGDSDVK